MQVKPQIKASILLGLFSLLLLHQTVPHSHHDHQEKHDHRIAKKSHNHSHEHEHEHEKESKDSKGFLSILLAMHSHGGSSTEVAVVREITQHILLKKVKIQYSSAQDLLLKNILLGDTFFRHVPNYQPPPKYFDPYLSFLSLRGPPQWI